MKPLLLPLTLLTSHLHLSFLSGQFIAAEVGCYYSSKRTSNGVSHAFNNISPTQCPIYSYNDTLHFSTSVNDPPQRELHNSQRDATGLLTFDLSIISEWCRENLVFFCLRKPICPPINYKTFQTNINFFFIITHQTPSTLLIILKVSLGTLTGNLDAG